MTTPTTKITVLPPNHEEPMSEGPGPVTEGFSTTTAMPDALQVKVLCVKCGIVNCDPSGDWCTSQCLCIHSEVGPKDCTEQQLLCVKVGPSGIKTETKIPDAIQVNCLLWKCGLTDFPDITKDDCCMDRYCCLYQNFGMKDVKQLQILCFKFDA